MLHPSGVSMCKKARDLGLALSSYPGRFDGENRGDVQSARSDFLSIGFLSIGFLSRDAIAELCSSSGMQRFVLSLGLERRVKFAVS